ncbi:hypothetical protein [Actinomycetospora lemnae]|uniref:Uncharacterized protein n=1 Tax=Actinomycetospora lemnae TaxID=3019891 RepID=A0ABT5SR89_9PSEU|nr:hypothetical protein [Actinomycetospora sp. DW7H6]MDD7965367.1 hypothetical protein [Actinomycetospora sp. DW7H6]
MTGADHGPTQDDLAAEHDRGRHHHQQGPRTRRDEKAPADGRGRRGVLVGAAILLVLVALALILGLVVL